MADNEVQIDSLSVAIEHSASTASKDLSSLASSLKKLQTSVVGLNLNNAIIQFGSLSAAIGGIGNNADKITALASSLLDLKSVGKVSAAVPKALSNQITALDAALSGVTESDVKRISSLASALTQLSSAKTPQISASIGHQLKSIGDAAKNLQGVNLARFKDLATALQPLSALTPAHLTSFINQLGKFTQLSKDLEAIDMDKFASTIERLTAAMAPLATEMDKIARGFSALPQRIQTFIKNNEAATSSVKKSKKEMGGWQDTLGKILGQLEKIEKKPSIFKKLISAAALSKINSIFEKTVISANKYIEDLNLFYVSMGGYAEKAQQYAEIVGDSYGINPGEFMRMQAVIMDVSKSFGVAGNTAYTMSKALTQLTYDISSLYNLNIDDAASKIQSALAGEIEPIRRLGKDLSVANLKLLATELGISANVDSMNQAEKAMLRTISLLRQSTSAMGDMARTLDQPANQFRILKAQLELLSRAIGDLFLPLVQKVLPYMTAFIKVSQRIVMAFAELAGFELPKFDYADTIVSGNEDIADSADSAAKSMKKLYLLSFDELNILGSQNTGSSGSGTSAADIAKLEEELNRLAKIENDAFSKSLGETTDAIAKQLEEWLTKGEGIEAWTENIWEHFTGIKEAASSILESLGKWEIPQKIWDFFKTAVFKITGIDLDFGSSQLGETSGETNLMDIVGAGIGALLGMGALKITSSMLGFRTSIPSLLLSIAALSITAEAIGQSPDVTGGQALLGAVKTGIASLLGGAAISFCTLGSEGFKAFGIPLTLALSSLSMSANGIIKLANDTGADDLAGAIDLGIGSLLSTAAASLSGVAVAKKFGAGAATAGTAGLFAGALSIIIGATIGAVVFPDECRKAFEAVSEALGHSIKNVTDSLKETIDKLVDLGSFDFKAQFGIEPDTFKVLVTFGDTNLAAKLNEISEIAKKNVTSTSGEFDNLNEKIRNSQMTVNQATEAITKDTVKTIKNGVADVTKSDIYKPLYDMLDKTGADLNAKSNSAGENVAKGFVSGIDYNAEYVAKGTIGMANKAMVQFTDALGIHSPSTVFQAYGIYVDLGFAQGISAGLPNVKDAFGDVWTSIRVDFSAFANGLLASARTFIRQLNQVLSSVSFSSVGAAQSLIGKTPRMIPAFATGGFPEDGMFYANSGELVGRFSNGRTAVANNAQIIEGIENAVYRAMTAAQRGAGRGGKIELVLDKQVVGRAFGDAIDSEKRRSGANTKITFTNGGMR